ncbi:hypothetical protein J3F84DRAFT_353262 [Trichoderma pleuroticola]
MSLPPPISAPARQTIKSAFENLDCTTTPADSRDFRGSTLAQVRDAALEIERQLAARDCEKGRCYRKILLQKLLRLDIRSARRVQSILGRIAFAKRPLKRLELLSAITFSSGEPDVASLVPESILDNCGPLIEERGDATVTFIHVSVKE